MNNDNDRSGMRADATAAEVRWSGARLRLVASRGKAVGTLRPSASGHLRAVATSAIALPSGSYDIRFASSRRSGASRTAVQPDRQDRRPRGRHLEGIIMKAFERLAGLFGRFAVGFGIGIALVSAFVIVTTDIGGTPKPVRPADIVHLDPVVVTISADRYAEIRAELHGTPTLARQPDRGLTEG